MLKNISQLEHKIGDRVYHFLCDQNSPLQEVKEALLQFISFVTQISNSAQPPQETKPPEQESKPNE